MLLLAGTSRDAVLVTNSCRCKINKDADSTKTINTALSKCRTILTYQLNQTKPKLIIALGTIAMKQLLGKKVKLSDCKGRFLFSDEFNCFVFVIWHPAFLLYRGVTSDYPNKSLKDMGGVEREYYKDFVAVRQFIEQGYSIDTSLLASYSVVKDITKADTILAIDFETTGTDLFQSSTEVLSVAINHTLRKNSTTEVISLKDKKLLPKELKNALENSNIHKIVASRPFEEAVCKLKFNTVIKGTIHDVLEMAHLVDENQSSYSLESVANVFTGLRNIKDVIGEKRKELETVSDSELFEYNSLDAKATSEVFRTLWGKLKEDKRLLRYYSHFILPAQDTLSDMYFSGIKIDTDVLRESEQQALQMLEKVKEDTLKLIPDRVKADHQDKLNLNRNDLIVDVLFKHKHGFRLKPDRKHLTPKTKVPQVSSEHLELFSHVPFVNYYLKYKKLSKIIPYISSLWGCIKPDGFVHPTTKLNGTVSGRTVMLNPPIQVLPERGDLAKLVKRAFVPREGRIMGSVDLRTSEFRIAGWLAGDENILKTVNNGIDLHTKTASLVNKIPLDKVTKEMRQSAKAVGFGFIFGMSAGGFQRYAKKLYGIDYTLKECSYIRERFFSKPEGYYKLPSLFSKLHKIVLTKGYIRSPLGRVRRFPEINAENVYIERIKNQAVNFPVQSTSTDFALLGLTLFNREIKTNSKFRDRVDILAFIHDASLFDADEDIFDEATKLLQECMEERVPEYVKKYFGITIGYKIETDSKRGYSWADME
jgi:DNA polymerase-1